MLLHITKWATKTYFGEEGCYPAFRKTEYIPVEFLREYRNYILVQVLPHKSASDWACGISQPYNITIDKDMITRGIVELL